MKATREPTSQDWAAMYMAMKLFEQVALYGNGQLTLVRFAKAVLQGEKGAE